MPNYNFDFLKSEHRLNDGEPTQHQSTVVSNQHIQMIEPFDPIHVRNKSDLEKQYIILEFLQKHRGSGSCLAPSLIYRATGIDLENHDVDVGNMLQNNPKVRTEFIPDPENPSLTIAHYAYQAKYPTVRDRTTLLAQINRMQTGVPTRDLLDSYEGIEQDINGLITAGDVIAISNTEDKDKVLFPRGEDFLVELDGHLCLPEATENPVNGLKTEICGVFTDVDPERQIRRGEAIQVGGQWFRVSSAVRAGVPLSEQPSRAQAPLSVVSLTDLSKKNEVDGYVRPFTKKHIPLDGALSSTAQQNILAARQARERLLKLGRSGGVTTQLTGSHAHASNPTTLATSFATGRKRPAPDDGLEQAASDPALALYSHARRHGCTKDVREMYLATKSLVPESDYDLQKLLVEHKLLEPDEQMRRPRLVVRTNLDNDGKPIKRRYYERKNQRNTNTHLQGTVIGAILAQAAEKQKQGKSVGDGGM